jgi:hypothetical protein
MVKVKFLKSDRLNELYYDPTNTASFSSKRKLYEKVKKNTTLTDVDEWLQSQNTYTLHKQATRKFQRNRYHVTNIDDLFQVDLIDLRSLKKHNDGISYILVVIDVFSKYTWVRPLKSKSGADVAGAFEDIFSADGRIPVNIQSDKGGEFLAGKVQRLFKKHDIKFYVAQNDDVKAAVVERVNRTLKSKMFKYFTHKNTYRYIDVLQDFVNAYNGSVHRTIKMAPKDVDRNNILQVYRNTYKDDDDKNIRSPKNMYKTGDYVRISKYKHVFEKGYENNWSDEIPKIVQVIPRKPVVYKIADLLSEPIDGVFYHQELQRIKYSPTASFQIERVLRKRYKKGRSEVLVQWVGYPAKFNSWIPAGDLLQI